MSKPCLTAKIIGLVIAGSLLSSCTFKNLKNDLDTAVQEYGYFKGQATGIDDGSSILIGLFERDPDGMQLANMRTVSSGETFYFLLPRADYTLFAFADVNSDFEYQVGDPSARIDEPFVNWFSELQIQDRLHPDTLTLEQFELTSTANLGRELDMSLVTLREGTKAAENFLRVVSWDEDVFSAENSKRSLWEPSWFQEEIGYGLYVLEEFDPDKKSILFVHGITDSPRVFKRLAGSIPADYQLLLFYYPSGFPLEYTSYVLNEALDELVRRDQIPQLDIIAHSMGGLFSKGTLNLADNELRQRLRLFVSIASPFGGHASAAFGTKWSPIVAPVWWAMVPDSPFLNHISNLDLSQGPSHHLIFSFSHEAGGKSEGDDGVVTVRSQLDDSAQRNATAVYGIADSHVGIVSNSCTAALVAAILQDGSSRVTFPDC